MLTGVPSMLSITKSYFGETSMLTGVPSMLNGCRLRHCSGVLNGSRRHWEVGRGPEAQLRKEPRRRRDVAEQLPCRDGRRG